VWVIRTATPRTDACRAVRHRNVDRVASYFIGHAPEIQPKSFQHTIGRMLAFVQILCVLGISCSVFSLTGCASLEANSQFYRTLPDPCAGRSRVGQDPLCGAPAL